MKRVRRPFAFARNLALPANRRRLVSQPVIVDTGDGSPCSDFIGLGAVSEEGGVVKFVVAAAAAAFMSSTS